MAINGVASEWEQVRNLHLQDYPRAHPPDPEPWPDALSAAEYSRLLKATEAEELAGVGRFDRSARAIAKQRAEHRVDTWLASQYASAFRRREELGQWRATWWDQLSQGHVETVMATINQAFEDNVVPSTCATVTTTSGESDALLVITAPDIADLPNQVPDVTPGGKPTLRRLSKTDLAAYYAEAVAAHAVATLKEAYDVAPTLTTSSVVSVRVDALGAFEAILAARTTRHGLQVTDWQRGALVGMAQQVDLIVNPKGRTQALSPLDLTDEPDLLDLMDALENAEVELSDEGEEEQPPEALTGAIEGGQGLTSWPPRWYPDPNHQAAERWWDGSNWTAHTR